MKKQHSQELDIWIKISKALDKIQEKTLNLESKSPYDIRDIILLLLESDLSIGKNELSIAFLPYGEDKAELIAYHGDVVDETLNEERDFTAETPEISQVINKNIHQLYLDNREKIKNSNFSGSYSSILIVPMRLNKNKNIGAFIFHNIRHEHAYSGNIPYIFDKLSDRFAFFIRENHRRNRNKLFDDIRNKIQARTFSTECKILKCFVELLSVNWYLNDQIYILIRNPLDKKRFFLACKESNVIEGFRKETPLTNDEINSIIGSEELLQQLKINNAVHINNISTTNTEKPYKSLLAARIHHPSGYNIGYIIIRNRKNKYAYDIDEARFLDSLSSFIALTISSFRDRRRIDYLQKIRKHHLHTNEHRNNFIGEIYDFMSETYGIKGLKVVIINKTKQQFKTSFNEAEITAFPKGKLPESKGFDQSANNIAHNLKEIHTHSIEDFILDYDESKYLVTPMRLNLNNSFLRIVGYFVIPAPNPGIIFANLIDDISDALATSLEKQEQKERYNTLREFGKKVSLLKHNEITKKEVLHLAKDYISKVMFSENLYISTYDKNNNEIKFPLILQDNKNWPMPKRTIDEKNQGRTEWIIINKKPILIFTKKQADDWYDQDKYPDRKEFAGDTLAAWAGVPIFLDGEVIGVIVVYHKKAEYVYSQYDIDFLSYIATYISELFRLLSISKELEESNNRVAEQERHLVMSQLAQDFAHQLRNRQGPIINNIIESMDIIKNNSNDEEKLMLAYDHLDYAKKSFDNFMREMDSSFDTKQTSVNILKVVNNIVNQSLISHNVIDRNIRSIVNAKIHHIKTILRLFYNCIQILVDNAIDAIISRLKNEHFSPYINIEISHTNNKIIIQIKDNGRVPTCTEEKKFFKLNFTTKGSGHGYGLWRAKTIALSLQGKLSFELDKKEGVKIFTLTLPKTQNNEGTIAPNSLIVEDDEGWIDLLSRWLSEQNHTTKVASTRKEAETLLKNNKKSFNYIFLDISLDYKHSENSDGLGLIETIREHNPDAKIVVVTGNENKASNYEDKIHSIIPKYSSDTGSLTKKIFYKEMGFNGNNG